MAAIHQLDSSLVHYEWNNGLAPRLTIDPGDTVTFDTRDPYELAGFWLQVLNAPRPDDDHPGDPAGHDPEADPLPPALGENHVPLATPAAAVSAETRPAADDVVMRPRPRGHDRRFID